MKKFTLLVLIMTLCCSCIFSCTTTNKHGNESTFGSESLSGSEEESESPTESEKENESTPNTLSQPEEITNDELIEEFGAYDYDYDYRMGVPRSIHISNRHLWDGTHPNVEYKTTFSESDGYDTFLTELLPTDKNYYFVYLHKAFIPHCVNYLNEFLQTPKWKNLSYNFSTVTDGDVIDGKYLTAFVNMSNNIEGVKLYKCDNLATVKYTIDDYRLIFCGQVKTAIIKSNLSTKKEINKEIKIYNRIVLKHTTGDTLEKESNFFHDYFNVIYFDYVGEIIELYKTEFAETEKIYFPKLGDFAGKYILPKEKVVVSNGKKYLQLPILYRHDTTKVLYDLLDETIDFSSDLYFIY